jgi:hypothetical protein
MENIFKKNIKVYTKRTVPQKIIFTWGTKYGIR